jgi:hypothetical protein
VKRIPLFTESLNCLALLSMLKSYKEPYVTQGVFSYLTSRVTVLGQTAQLSLRLKFDVSWVTCLIQCTAVNARLLLAMFKEGAENVLRLACSCHT